MALDERWGLARAPRWGATLLDSRERSLGELPGVRGGRIEVVSLSRLGGSASLELSYRGVDIDPFTQRVALSYDPGVEGLDPLPMGVYLFSSPRDRWTYVRQQSFELIPKLATVDEDSFDESYSVPAGANIVSAVVDVIESAGETAIAATPSGATLTNGMSWEAGESKLTIINDLLNAAGYSSLWTDGYGQFRVEPYIEPGRRETVHVFESGDKSLHKAEWEREQNLVGIPNQVIVVCGGDDETPPIIGKYINTDPNDPLSTANRRTITRKEEASDIASLAEANAYAKRLYQEQLAPVATITATHAILPLEQAQVIRFIAGDQDVRATIQRMEFDMSAANSQCAATWRVVS